MLQRFLSGMMRGSVLTARSYLLFCLIVPVVYLWPVTIASGAEPAISLQQQAAQQLTPQSIQTLPAEVRSQLTEALSSAGASPGAAEAGDESTLDDTKKAAETKTAVAGCASGAKYSAVESRYRLGYDSILARDLRQFGYDFFRQATPKPSRLAVPGDDYVLGPGDRLRIRLWGSGIDAEFSGVVDRNGTINVPRIGIVPVTGVRFGQVEQVIRQEAEKYIQGININVSFVELRNLEIYVVGAVARPGLHLVPAFSTVIDGLMVAGGVHKLGSLRSAVLYRNGTLYKEVDLYELLLSGHRNGDVQLENRDVIYVPRIGDTAAVAGAVKQEGIFELKNEKTVGQLLDLVGGILPQGFTGRIYLRRYVENREFVIQDIDTTRTPGWRETVVQPGDLLELQFLSPAMPMVVRLTGHVFNPDVFRYEPGLTLRDVLNAPDLFKPNAVMDFALLHRYDQESTRYTVHRIPLEQVLRGNFNQELRPHDRIEILSREQLGIKEEIRVAGAVWKPGVLSYRPALTVADAIALAGGVKFGARVQQVEVSRQQVEGERVTTRHFLVDITRQADFALQPFDYLMVPQIKDHATIKTVTLSGEVRFPGEYRIADGERLSDLIARAGGFLPEAYYFGAKYTTLASKEIQRKSLNNLIRELEIRVQSTMQQQVQTSVSKDEVEAAMASREAVRGLIEKLKAIEPEGRVSIVLSDLESFKGSVYDFELSDGDVLHIPRRPFFVATVGSVYSPSSYLYEPNRTVGYYLDKSGGPTKNADDKHIYVLRANGEVVSAAQRGLFGFSGGINSCKLMPGDTVVVPEDLERVPYLRTVKDVADIVFKIATTAGIAIAAL